MFKELSNKQLLIVALSVEKYKLNDKYTLSTGKDIDKIQYLLKLEIKSRDL